MWAPAELTKSAATLLRASRKVEQRNCLRTLSSFPRSASTPRIFPHPLQGILCGEIFIGQRGTSDTNSRVSQCDGVNISTQDTSQPLTCCFSNIYGSGSHIGFSVNTSILLSWQYICCYISSHIYSFFPLLRAPLLAIVITQENKPAEP